MPTYEYHCDACEHDFEKFQSMSADPIKVCPSCGKKKLRRLIGTGAGLIFKGSGFYITDYRDKGYAEKAKAESGAGGGEAKPSESSTGGSSDAKPAATTTEAKPAAAEKKAEPKPTASETPKTSTARPAAKKEKK